MERNIHGSHARHAGPELGIDGIGGAVPVGGSGVSWSSAGRQNLISTISEAIETTAPMMPTSSGPW